MENPSLDEVTRSSAQLSFARASQNLAILRRDGRSRSTALPGNAPIGEIQDLPDRESGGGRSRSSRKRRARQFKRRNYSVSDRNPLSLHAGEDSDSAPSPPSIQQTNPNAKRDETHDFRIVTRLVPDKPGGATAGFGAHVVDRQQLHLFQ